jgi:O-antigen ligase
MSKTIKNILPYYLLFLLPFLIIPGIALVEFSAALIIIFFFFKNNKINYYKNFVFLFLIFFSIYVAVNAFFQIHDNLKYSSFFFFRFSLLSLSIFFILSSNVSISNNIKKKILFFFVILNILIFIDSYVQFLFGNNILGYKIIGSTVSSFFGSELILGSFLIKILPLFLFLLFYTNFDLKKYSLMILIFLSLYFSVIYISGGRTPFFLMILFIFFSLFFIIDLRSVLLKSLLILTIFISLSFVIQIGKSNPADRIFVKTFSEITNNYFNKNNNDILISKIELNKEIKIFSNHHHGHYVLAYHLFKQNPIWGIGPKGFRHYCRSVDYNPPIGICSTHPHNFLIQIILEIGLIGLIFYLVGLIFIFFNLCKVYFNKSFTNKNCFFAISIGLIVNFFPFVPNGNFFNNWISIMNFYYIGLYMYSYKKTFDQ